MNARALASDLARRVEGEVRFDHGSRALYATDASNYRQVPIGVVLPRGIDDVVATMAVAREHGAPVLARGGGTSLAGQCCNAAVIMDTSKYMGRVLEIDPARKIARVQPGVVLDELRAAAEAYRLTFGPDPSTHSHCTLGGMIGNNSCGVHSVLAEFRGPGPRTGDSVVELDVLTYDGLRLRVGPTPEDALAGIVAQGGRRGEIYAALRALRDRYAEQIRARFPRIPRRVSGYDLPQLLPENGFNVARALVGTESTCVAVLEATVQLVPSPRFRTLVVLGYPSVYEAGDHIPEIREFRPIGLEGMDDRLVDDMKRKRMHPERIQLLPEGRGWLLVEFGGESEAEADGQAHDMMDRLRRGAHPPAMKLFHDRDQEQIIWKVRESGLGATARVPGRPDTWEGWEDSSVSPERLGEYLRGLRHLLERHGYECALYGHFGQGCVHTRIDFDLVTADGIRRFRRFLHDAAELVVGLGGSLSGEHGDGQSRGELLPIMFGSELMEAFREFKRVWDPLARMNPGKVIDAYHADENLRLGTSYRPAEPRTWFKWPGDDHGKLSRAALRCVGVGECRKHEGGTMCPSYMVTREEKHSTRGRARLLWEMLQGEVITDGWRSEAVKDALDLCLACKGCKGECPVNVDMATYKAEFLSHYYARRLRPRHAYAFGLIDRWARLAALAPRLVNFATRSPGFGDLAKAIAGMAPERQVPSFAPETFQRWFRRRGTRGAGLRVILWPDTFNNHFHPETSRAAVEVLEAAGCQVVVPDGHVCCGRPLYDYGMLETARAYLGRTLDQLGPLVAAGVPVVALEPSCMAVFRDELPAMLPDDERARRLSTQTFTLGEFLARLDDYVPPRVGGAALLHGHCHQTSLVGLDAERALLERAGVDVEVLDSGCCGMAGSFGFERGHYEISRQVGERVLLPAVRRTRPETMLIADGFSCREQIAQLTGRSAWHLADVLQSAIGPTEPAAVRQHRRRRGRHAARWAFASAGMLVAGALLARAAVAARHHGRVSSVA